MLSFRNFQLGSAHVKFQTGFHSQVIHSQSDWLTGYLLDAGRRQVPEEQFISSPWFSDRNPPKPFVGHCLPKRPGPFTDSWLVALQLLPSRDKVYFHLLLSFVSDFDQ